jgi:uncharacterized protein (TIGR03437 family)
MGWMAVNEGDPLYNPTSPVLISPTPEFPKTLIKDTFAPTLNTGYPIISAGGQPNDRTIQLLVNDKPATLYYAGKDQVNFLVPSNTQTNTAAEIQIVRVSTGQILAASSVEMNTVSPGLFNASGGSGQLIAQNVEDDGRFTINSAQNPISRSKILVLYGTGQGVVPGAPPDGSPATDASPTPDRPRIALGTRFLDPADILYSGLAPGLVGVWQINIKIPDWVAPGTQVPIALSLRDVSSNGVQPPPFCTQGQQQCQQRTWIAVKQ